MDFSKKGEIEEQRKNTLREENSLGNLDSQKKPIFEEISILKSLKMF